MSLNNGPQSDKPAFVIPWSTPNGLQEARKTAEAGLLAIILQSARAAKAAQKDRDIAPEVTRWSDAMTALLGLCPERGRQAFADTGSIPGLNVAAAAISERFKLPKPEPRHAALAAALPLPNTGKGAAPTPAV